MDYLIISIGQAGNQINFELSNLLLNNDNFNNIFNNNFSKTFQGDLAKSILIDSEQKVVKKFTDKNFNKNCNFYKEGVNLITNSSGRGNNWALSFLTPIYVSFFECQALVFAYYTCELLQLETITSFIRLNDYARIENDMLLIIFNSISFLSEDCGHFSSKMTE